MRRLVWLLAVLVLLGVACDPSSEAERAALDAAEEEERNYVEPAAEEEVDPTEQTTIIEDATEPGDPSGEALDEEDAGNVNSDAAVSDVGSPLVGLENGVWDEERVLRIDLAAPIADPTWLFELEFRSNENDRIIARFTPSEGSTSSFCVGQTPSCPDGIFPIVGLMGSTGDALSFTFALDAFDNSTGVSIGASIKTGPDGDLIDELDPPVLLSDEQFDTWNP